MLVVVRNTLGSRFPKAFILLFDLNGNVRVADVFKCLNLQNTLKSIKTPFKNELYLQKLLKTAPLKSKRRIFFTSFFYLKTVIICTGSSILDNT